MQLDPTGAVFKVLSSDNLIYGPIDFATLAQWVQERRVQRQSWIHWETANKWIAAGAIDALQPEFDALTEAPEEVPSAAAALPGSRLMNYVDSPGSILTQTRSLPS